MMIQSKDINIKNNCYFMELSTIYNGQYYERGYNGYSKKESIQMFKNHVKEEDAKIFYNIEKAEL